MFVVYLNPALFDAFKLAHPNLNAVTSYDDVMSFFSYSDLNVIQAQSAMVAQYLEQRVLGKEGYLFPIGYNISDSEAPKLSPNTVLASLTESELASYREDLKECINTLDCTMLNESTALLYASDSTGNRNATTLETVFCAMALIMSQGAVMQTGMYEQFVQNM